jgi:lipopolysaccharide export system permease protein
MLHRYFARRFLFTFAGVFAVFFAILGFLDLVEQLGKFAGDGVSFTQIIGLTLLNTPEALYRILPLITILATIALFLSLARSSEMIVTRAAGRSALRALIAPVVVALLIGILAVAILNPIVAATSTEYAARATALRNDGSNILSVSSEGLFLRQGDATQQTVIRAEAASREGTLLERVTFLSFDERGPLRRIEADLAQLTPGAWLLTNAKSWPLADTRNAEAAATTHAMLDVPSTLTADQIRDGFGTPSAIPIWELPVFINRLEAAGFSARRHAVWFQMELALPAFLVSMVLVAAGLTMRNQRGGRTGMAVLTAIMLGFGLYFLRSFAQILGENGQIPAVLSAWAPPAAAICLALGLLLHLEDG